jgi:hypothetical protein
MPISSGGICSANKGLAFFPQNGAAVPINRAGVAARPYISLRV